MKPKASTMQQRMGFADADLTSPKHDELVLWLVENREEVARQCGFDLSKPRLEWESVDKKHFEPTTDEIERANEMFLVEAVAHAPRVSIKLEHPIMDRSFTIGFIDAVITAESWKFHAGVMKEEISHAEPGYVSWVDGGPAFRRRVYVVAGRNYQNICKFYIEAKPTVPSFGELLRQLRHYEPYIHHDCHQTRLFVCSPDTRFKAALEQQGIGFIVAPQ